MNMNDGEIERDSNERELIEQECAQKLRLLRRKRGLTLEECELLSGGRFKAVVLGSYERGTRAISLARLSHLADFYEVSIDYFLSSGIRNDSLPPKGRWVFDLRRLRQAKSSTFPINFLTHALGEIAIERSDWEGELLSLRRDDSKIFEVLFGEKRQDILQQLQESKILRIL